MAKSKGGRILVKLLSTANTGYFYTTSKNPAKAAEKLFLRKYDPVVRQHVWFRETKLESGRKR